LSYPWHEPDPTPDEFELAEMEHAYAEEADRRVKEERLEALDYGLCPHCRREHHNEYRCIYCGARIPRRGKWVPEKK